MFCSLIHTHTHHTHFPSLVQLLSFIFHPRPSLGVSVLFVLQVGAKCRVEMEHEWELSTCHIQQIFQDKSHCVVFVEKLGKKLLVALSLPTYLPLVFFVFC